jgi:hypothetical protein
MERLAAAAVPRVAHRALATLPAARPPPAAVSTHRDPSFCARGFAARGRFFAGRPRATHARWVSVTPDAIRRGDRGLVATPRAIVETETSEAETTADDDAPGRARAVSSDRPSKEDDPPQTDAPIEMGVSRPLKNPIANDASSSVVDDAPPPPPPPPTARSEGGASFKPLTEGFEVLADVVATATTKLRGATNMLQAKTRAATHPPLPVVSTFDELLRFARIASLNSAPASEIEAFFAETAEEVVVLDMVSVKQRLFIATDHARKRHTISFRGTTNLTNVVQNIRLSNDPVRASGRLASVGRSLSGAFSGLTVSGKKTGSANDAASSLNETRIASDDPSSASSSDPDETDGGSFDEGDDALDALDAETCANVDWSSATPESLARLGCTDHLPMHRGYRIVARECADALAPLMTPGYSVQLTGHSLGGAVAVATALLLRVRGVEVDKVVTFGAPKLGPRETRDAAEPLDILRVVQKDDLIPLLPMSRPFVRKPYVHLGEGLVLDNDAPGRYARLTKEWGTAGILWKQRRHTGYARGDTTNNDATSVMADDTRRFKDTTNASLSAFVSADEPDEASSASESASEARARRGRFSAARARLARLRAALGEGIARRRAAFAAESNVRGGVERPGTEPEDDGTRPISSLFDGATTTFDAKVSADSAETRDSSRVGADPAPFDDVEGELFVRVAETTPFGGASDVAAAAADEWERAAAATESPGGPSPFSQRKPPIVATRGARASSRLPDDDDDAAAAVASEPSRAARTWLVGDARGAGRSDAGVAPRGWDRADHRAGPTIFEELWKLRGLDAESRGNRLESHRMRRYVDEIQRAIDAGPVQTSLAGVYDGKEGDEVGLDFSGDESEDDEDGAVQGGLASWMTWTR